ncbi:LapA family protein [Kaarinaea lacus]
MKRIIKLILILLVTVLAVTFTLLNSQPVKLDFYIGNFETDLVIVILVCLVLGSVLGITAVLGKLISFKQELLRKDKKIKVTEKEVENLRSLPLKDE